MGGAGQGNPAAQQAGQPQQPNQQAPPIDPRDGEQMLVMSGKAFKIPEFSGKESQEKIELWKDRAHKSLSSSGLMRAGRETEAVSYVTYVFKDVAYEWFKRAERETPEIALDVNEFWRQFDQRFVKRQTDSQKALLRETLKQKANESVRDFSDRCFNTQVLLWKDKPAEMKALQSYKMILDDEARSHFVGGCKPAIKQALDERYPDITDLKSATQIAILTETALSKTSAVETCETEVAAVTPKVKPKAPAAETKKEPTTEKAADPMEQLVNALSRVVGTTGGRGRAQQGRGRARGRARTRGRGAGPANGTCFLCNQPGHWARNCPRRGSQQQPAPAQGRGRGYNQIGYQSAGQMYGAYAVEEVGTGHQDPYFF